MTTAQLGEVIRPASGRAGDSRLPVYSVTKHKGFVPSKEYFTKQVFSNDTSDYKVVEPGNFAYATIHLDEGSIGIAPERCIISPMYTVFSVDESRIDRGYLLRFLKAPSTLPKYSSLGRGTAERRKSIPLAALGRLTIPLPPLPKQRRIAAILDEADALRSGAHSRAAIAESVAVAAFRELEASLGFVEAIPLAAIADVTSGITKGRRAPSAPLQSVPYMTVANVQDKRLSLTSVKEIEASAAEIERYRLLHGDLLLTEGGDPDKLGRGVVWRDELPLSIHQNHVFRVRLMHSNLDPTWLNWEIGSEYGKRYFLRAAKQTTGIATINSSQLKSFPVRVPPPAARAAFLTVVEAASRSMSVQARAQASLDALFASLQHRAFRGEL